MGFGAANGNGVGGEWCCYLTKAMQVTIFVWRSGPLDFACPVFGVWRGRLGGATIQ